MVKKHKKKKILLFSVLILIIAGFFVNWFLTYRLQDFLRETLSNKLSEATNGFYKLKYDKLSVGLFNGELKIEGLEIYPDSVVFERLSENDSLPETYFDIRIQSIDFKGINLTWMRSYRKLHFNLFEVKKPVIEINRPYISNDKPNEIDSTSKQNLYEIISPFFDEVSVKTINLENATISYTMFDELIPSVYALQDVSFHAFGFKLNEDSYKSGKLLFCDNFDFTSNGEQRLLLNNQFILSTDSIKLNTQDSTILVKGIKLLPQKELWEMTQHWSSSFIDAQVKAIKAKGVYFLRKNSRNYLNVHTFDILSSNIEYTQIDTLIAEKKKNRTIKKDTLLPTWSLHKILAPVLNSIILDKINVSETKFKYVQVKENGIDQYLLNNFNFQANRFNVDSISDINPKLLYADNFAFDADSLQADIQSLNHRIEIGKISLNTKKQMFFVHNVRLNPIEEKNRHDYMSGSIDSVIVNGLDFSHGISAEYFQIKNPDIEYTVNNTIRKRASLAEKDTEEDIEIVSIQSPTTIDLVAELTSRYYIKKIEVSNANFNYITKNRNIDKFSIKGFNFFAHDFLVDENTRNHSEWYFDCSNFGFNLKYFNNYILDKQYHLSAKDISFSGLKGNLAVRNLMLIPQTKHSHTTNGQYLKLITPIFLARGIDFEGKTLKINALSVEKPEIGLYQEFESSIRKSNVKNTKTQRAKTSSIHVFNNMRINRIDINETDFEYIDKTSDNKLDATFNSLKVSDILWDFNQTKTIKVNEINLKAPHINYSATNPKKEDSQKAQQNSPQSIGSGINSVSINKVIISDIETKASIPNKEIKLELGTLLLSKLDWKMNQKSHLNLGSIDIYSPNIDLAIHQPMKDNSSQKEEQKKKDIYETIGSFSDKISIKNFNLHNANADYRYSSAMAEAGRQQLHNINVSVEGFEIDNKLKKIDIEDASFSTKDLSFPIDNGFYTINIDSIRLSQRGEKLLVNNVRMKSTYPKMEFAYKHPRNKDWFDLELGSFVAKGINISEYFADSILKIDDIQTQDIVLKNFKNQDIEIQHNIMPMIYEVLQKAPIKFDVKNMDVRNFSVIYEELTRNAESPGKIFFTEMNGHLKGLTNIVSRPQQYITLNADGKLMGSGYFIATWEVPVDPNNDRFILRADLNKFDLKELNQLIFPMAKAQISSGTLNSVKFNMDASSIGSHIGMQFLYNDLRISVMRKKDGEFNNFGIASSLANALIRKNNPNKPSGKPRTSDIYVTRDPYHSTFNYLWQILQPALVESVGISQGKQNFFRSLPKIPLKLKNFFWKGKPLQEEDNKTK